MIKLEILDYNRNFVSEWSWEDNFPIPSKGDTILVHLGDDNEMEYRVTVLCREFDGTKPNAVRIVTDYVKFNKKEIDETMLP